MAEFSGKVTVVTGGGSGLGEATCRVLAEAGATVVVADVRLDQAERVAEELRGLGGPVVPMEMDVADELSAEVGVSAVVAEHGRIDVLVNGASIEVVKPVEELSVDEWDRVLDVNLRGPLVLSRLVFPEMRRQGGGHIVNVASTAAKRAWASASGYHASQWGLLGLSHALHVEGRPHGIKVTVLVAGGMRSPSLLDRLPDPDPALLQDPRTVAETIRFVLALPDEAVVPEMMVLPLRETSWP